MSFPVNPHPLLTYRPRMPYRQPLGQEEAKGVGKALAGYAQTGLQAGLHVLDTPGSIVRKGIGYVTGARPKQGERTSGRDILDSLGVTSRHSRGWGATLGGLAVDVATDPLTYLTLGTHSALTGAGKAIAKSGGIKGLSRKAMLEGFHGLESSHLAEAARLGKSPAQASASLTHARNQGARIATPAEEAAVQAATGRALKPNEPLGGLAGIGVPFRDPSTILGTGPHAQAFAGKLDTLGDKLRFGNPLGRSIGALFDPSVNEATGGATQRAFATYGRPALESAKAASRDETYRVMAGIDSAIKSGLPEDQVLRAARQHAEGASLRGASPQITTAAQPIADIVRRSGDSRLAESVKLGLPLSDLADPFVAHVPRQGIDLGAARQVAAGKAPVRIGVQSGPGNPNNLPIASSANYHRDVVYRGIPGGTEMINDWVRTHAGDPLGLGQYGVRRTVLRDMVGEVRASGTPITRDVVGQLRSKASDVAKRLRGLSPDHSEHGIGLYSPNLTQDLGRAGEQHAKTVATAKAVYGFLGDNARPTRSLPSDAVPVSQVLILLRRSVWTVKAGPVQLPG